MEILLRSHFLCTPRSLICIIYDNIIPFLFNFPRNTINIRIIYKTPRNYQLWIFINKFLNICQEGDETLEKIKNKVSNKNYAWLKLGCLYKISHVIHTYTHTSTCTNFKMKKTKNIKNYNFLHWTSFREKTRTLIVMGLVKWKKNSIINSADGNLFAELFHYRYPDIVNVLTMHVTTLC